MHICNFMIVQSTIDTYVCVECGLVHQCGRDYCDSLMYNSEYTNVCMLTGLCFEQRMCASSLDDVNIFVKKIKRDQQIKNKILDHGTVLQIIECAASIIDLTPKQNSNLCTKIIQLWSDFVLHISGQHYVHRKDKRCFVVAIAMSLVSGIKNNIGVSIVLPHTHIKRIKLNKKSKYDEFDVSDIRYGQNLIKRVFKGVHISPNLAVFIR